MGCGATDCGEVRRLSERTGAVAATNYASPDPGKCPEQTAFVATTSQADPIS